VLLTKQELALTLIEICERHGVDPALACAIVEVSSGWNAAKTEWHPSLWFLRQDTEDWGGFDRWRALGTRYGAMQVRGEEAWKAGYKKIDKLADTEQNLEAGVMVLKTLLPGDEQALLLWFGAEGRSLAKDAFALLPQFRKFVQSKPEVSHAR
jgi:hypothetical protein